MPTEKSKQDMGAVADRIAAACKDAADTRSVSEFMQCFVRQFNGDSMRRAAYTKILSDHPNIKRDLQPYFSKAVYPITPNEARNHDMDDLTSMMQTFHSNCDDEGVPSGVDGWEVVLLMVLRVTGGTKPMTPERDHLYYGPLIAKFTKHCRSDSDADTEEPPVPFTRNVRARVTAPPAVVAAASLPTAQLLQLHEYRVRLEEQDKYMALQRDMLHQHQVNQESTNRSMVFMAKAMGAACQVLQRSTNMLESRGPVRRTLQLRVSGGLCVALPRQPLLAICRD
jgi:hypothetical protein